MAELKITAANFENEVLRSDKPVLLDFYADWCGPCKMISPILHELAEEKSGTLKVGKVNVDEQMELAMRFQVSMYRSGHFETRCSSSHSRYRFSRCPRARRRAQSCSCPLSASSCHRCWRSFGWKSHCWDRQGLRCLRRTSCTR